MRVATIHFQPSHAYFRFSKSLEQQVNALMRCKTSCVAKNDSVPFPVGVHIHLKRSGIHSVVNDGNLQLWKFFFEKSGQESRWGDNRLRAKENFLRDIQP